MRQFSLRPLVVEIAAPRALVFEMAASVTGSLPGSPPHIAELLERDGDVLLVRYRMPALLGQVTMVERVRLYPPDRIEFEVVEGPIDHVRELLAFEPLDAYRTRVTYGGSIGSRRRLVGDSLVRFVAMPAYDRFMRRQLEALRVGAEERARRSRRYLFGRALASEPSSVRCDVTALDEGGGDQSRALTSIVSRGSKSNASCSRW